MATLSSGGALFPNPQQDSVFSDNGSFQLIMQQDGNLVLYKTVNLAATAIWASQTNGQQVGQCNMQTDGNLVIYTADQKPIWASHTNGHNGSHLEVQDDGNVVIYTANQKPIWATNTQGR
jgi:hypothetical protein